MGCAAYRQHRTDTSKDDAIVRWSTQSSRREYVCRCPSILKVCIVALDDSTMLIWVNTASPTSDVYVLQSSGAGSDIR